MNHLDYYGYETGQISNSFFSIDYLTIAGPRIVRVTLRGESQNLLYETPDTIWPTPNGPFRLFGGHRLWKSPESRAFTYIPDSDGLHTVEIPGGVKLIQTVEPQTGIEKSLKIELDDQKPVVRLQHELRNCGNQVWTFAPWALTMLPLGGTAIIPLPTLPMDAENLLPNRNLVFWPYARIHDPRLHLEDGLITLGTSAESEPFKMGLFMKDGWLKYQRDGVSFIKRTFTPAVGEYPDRGCNLEVYTNHQFIELETLGPLVSLQPGETTLLSEEWTIQRGEE
jgi:hypothetical protein